LLDEGLLVIVVVLEVVASRDGITLSRRHVSARRDVLAVPRGIGMLALPGSKSKTGPCSSLDLWPKRSSSSSCPSSSWCPLTVAPVIICPGMMVGYDIPANMA
jgi:hypothetical protein